MSGIKWSAPVLIRKDGKGLAVTLPQKVVDTLKVGVGDVLNFTELPDGGIEVWMVKKSGYSSLADMQASAKPKAGTKKSGGKK